MGGMAYHKGEAIALPYDNVDTDQIIPARFMSAPRSQGYESFLFHDLRRGADGEPNENLPLNKYPNASLLVAGRNFGSGSSREAAVYALVDAGFKVVIAPSFGDIFASNAVNNGLLPARLQQHEIEEILAQLADSIGVLAVDLNANEVRVGTHIYHFDLDEAWKTKLINGWDDIDLTHQHASQIAAYKDNRIQTASWAWPAAAD